MIVDSWWFPNKKASNGDGNWWDQSPLITIDSLITITITID